MLGAQLLPRLWICVNFSEWVLRLTSGAGSFDAPSSCEQSMVGEPELPRFPAESIWEAAVKAAETCLAVAFLQPLFLGSLNLTSECYLLFCLVA